MMFAWPLNCWMSRKWAEWPLNDWIRCWHFKRYTTWFIHSEVIQHLPVSFHSFEDIFLFSSHSSRSITAYMNIFSMSILSFLYHPIGWYRIDPSMLISTIYCHLDLIPPFLFILLTFKSFWYHSIIPLSFYHFWLIPYTSLLIIPSYFNIIPLSSYHSQFILALYYHSYAISSFPALFVTISSFICHSIIPSPF